MSLFDLLVEAIRHMTLMAAIGWVGVTLIFSAFLLNSHHILESGDWRYLAMNVVGSALFGADLYVKASWSGVTLQTVWILIAISAAVGALRKKAAG